jgi:predicted MPP superfamily phosphohydrolase
VVKERDFSNLNRFPGETGNLFDVILHRFEIVQRIPWPIFALVLFGLAVIGSWFDWSRILVLWAFFLLDWTLLAALPRARRSYGPPKPPVLILAVLRAIFSIFPFWIFLGFQVIGTCLVIYAFWIEPHRLKVTHQVLASPKFHSEKPLRLLHLGDLHIERITGREERLVQLVSDLKPDIILFSGDILNLSYLTDPLAWEAARKIISQWQAPLGVYFVSGSPAVDLPEIMPDLIKDLGVKRLQEDKITVEFNQGEFDIIGLTCTHRPQIDIPLLSELTQSEKDPFTILLYHSPDLAPAAARMGVDLQLSGHTHGGQVRIPGFGALFTGSLYGKAFESGRRQIGNMTLYVTRGIGLEGAAAPRVRLFCPPEIILWEIVKSSKEG